MMSGILFDCSPLVVPVSSVATRENNTHDDMTSITVVGAAQHNGWVRDNYLVYLSDYVGYVFVVCLIASGPLFTLHGS